MASGQNISVNGDKNKDIGRTPTATAAPIRNALRESLWSRSEDTSMPVKDANAKTPDSFKTCSATEEREAKMRRFREAQEAELARRRRGLEEHLLSAQKLRQQQEDERRRRLEEGRRKEEERRIQVEERKRQIWEAEQERKEAILRRNLDREARIEARRNAHRNAIGVFAFGSSTPRTFELELGQLGEGLMVTPPVRASSACSLQGLRNNAEDNMSRSMVSLSSSSSSNFRGRRRTDITPTPRSHTPRGGSPPHFSAPRMRGTVSMTRLDQLAQPRRTFHQPPSNFQSPPPSVRRSMINLSPPTHTNRMGGGLSAPPPTAGSSHRPMGAARSMLHLNVAVTPPRLTRAARLRAQAASAWNLSSQASTSTSSGGKPLQGSRSPPRPPSSLSDVSAASSSAIHLRPRSAPRRPRPVSVAGMPSHSTSLSESIKKPTPRPQGSSQPSAKSTGRDTSVPLQGQRPSKPLPPPKPSEWKTKPRPTPPPPSKDNLRLKVTRTTTGKQVEEPKQAKPPVNTSTLTSPDSEAFQVSSDDSKTWSMTDSRGVSVSQSSIGISESNKDIQLLTESSQTGVTELKESQSKSESLGGSTIQSSVEIVRSTTETEVAIQSMTVAQQHQETTEETTEDVTTQELVKLMKPNEEKSEPYSKPPEQDALVESLSELCVNKPDESLSQQDQSVSKPEPLLRETKPEPPPRETKPEHLPRETKPEPLPRETKPEPLPRETKPEHLPRETKPDLIMSSSWAGSETENANRRLITSEEEARAALAEKRRLAREQAELERQRQEEERRLEAERRAQEEAEQERLLEEHRRHEEEKLARAIAEQQLREEELRIKREEESKLRAEKEEQERRAREEAERQRVELAEKLRKEEEERAERKRRVEQIMARTRGAAAAAATTPTTNGTTTPATTVQQNPVQHRNGSEPVSNGYSSQEDMSCTTSPEDEGVLIDLVPTPSLNVTSRHPLDDTLNSNLCSPTDNANRTTQNPPDLLL